MENENRENDIDQLFMLSGDDSSNNPPSIDEDPNYYYNFVMDDEDPIAAVETMEQPVLAETDKLVQASQRSEIQFTHLKDLEDSFHENLINNLVCTGDIFNDTPEHAKTDQDIYDSLNNYILGRGRSLQTTTEGMRGTKNYRSELSWKTENATGGAENMFLLDVLYNPKLTDDFVCGSFTSAIKTPLTRMYDCEPDGRLEAMITLNFRTMSPVTFGLVNYTMGYAQQTKSKKLMGFSQFISSAIPTINYNVIEVDDWSNDLANKLNKNMIYSLRCKNNLNPIDLVIKNIKVNYIEFDNCLNLKNLRIENSEQSEECIGEILSPKGIIFHDTSLIYIDKMSLDNLFSPSLVNLFINFSGFSGCRSSVIKNIEEMRMINKDFNTRERKQNRSHRENENFSRLKTIVTSSITNCTGLKMLFLSGCILPEDEFILPPNLREFWAINTKFSSRFVLPPSLFVLRIVDCDISQEVLAESLAFLPEILYQLHIETGFCITDFLKRRNQPMPYALQKIYCDCCDKQIVISNYDNPKNFATFYHFKVNPLSKFEQLNRYCLDNFDRPTKYPGLKYYLDTFYREPCAKFYETVPSSDLYCCVSNYLIAGSSSSSGFVRGKCRYLPTEYMRDDLRIIDIIKRITAGRTIIAWVLSNIVVDTYDGKLPPDLIKYISFIAYPRLGIDVTHKFDEYKNLIIGPIANTDYRLHYEWRESRNDSHSTDISNDNLYHEEYENEDDSYYKSFAIEDT